MGDKVDGATKSQIESGIASLKTAMEGDDTATITRLSEELMQSSHKLAEAMYQKASQSGGDPSGGGPNPGAGQPGGQPGPGGDDVVDADFEEVKK